MFLTARYLGVLRDKLDDCIYRPVMIRRTLVRKITKCGRKDHRGNKGDKEVGFQIGIFQKISVQPFPPFFEFLDAIPVAPPAKAESSVGAGIEPTRSLQIPITILDGMNRLVTFFHRLFPDRWRNLGSYRGSQDAETKVEHALHIFQGGAKPAESAYFLIHASMIP